MKRPAIFLVVSILFIVFIFYGYQMCWSPNILVDREGGRVLLVKEGTTFAQLQKKLYQGGFVNDMVSFSFLARLKRLDKKIHPGRYFLKANMSNLEAINALRTGKQEPVSVTYSHVRLRSELSERITGNLGMTPGEFENALSQFVHTNKDGFNDENILCLFLPNTYEVYYNVTPAGLVARMHREFNDFWNEEYRAQARAMGLTPIEVSILASIVQAETVREDEAPRIAGLYVNRLRQHMALQADPTVVFALKDFTLKRVLNSHKAVKSPYNTYLHAGLPPGPINLPRLAIIKAVLNHEKHPYLYMCASEDFSGYHKFTKSYQAHLANARIYQKALTIEIKKGQAMRK